MAIIGTELYRSWYLLISKNKFLTNALAYYTIANLTLNKQTFMIKSKPRCIRMWLIIIYFYHFLFPCAIGADSTRTLDPWMMRWMLYHFATCCCNRLLQKFFQLLQKKFCKNVIKAVFLVMCDPSLNELWAT